MTGTYFADLGAERGSSFLAVLITGSNEGILSLYSPTGILRIPGVKPGQLRDAANMLKTAAAKMDAEIEKVEA